MTDSVSRRAGAASRREFLLGLTAMGAGLWAARAGSRAADLWPLFSVEGQGNRVYLVGETPPRPARWHDLRIESLVSQCSVLWTETNNIYKANVQDLIARYGLDEGHPLDSRLTEMDRERLAKASEVAQVPLASLATLRPWVAGGMLEDGYYKARGMSDAADKLSPRNVPTLYQWHMIRDAR
jgi:uncharacterized protein